MRTGAAHVLQVLPLQTTGASEESYAGQLTTACSVHGTVHAILYIKQSLLTKSPKRSMKTLKNAFVFFP